MNDSKIDARYLILDSGSSVKDADWRLKKKCGLIQQVSACKLGKKVVSAKLFKDHSPLKFVENDFGVRVKVPKSGMDEIDTIVELEVR